MQKEGCVAGPHKASAQLRQESPVRAVLNQGEMAGAFGSDLLSSRRGAARANRALCSCR